MYAVQMRVYYGKIIKSLPTFYLDATVQGILNDEHAKAIATELIGRKVASIHVSKMTSN